MSFIPSRLARAHGMLWLIACAALALPAQAQTDTGSSPRKAASTKKAPAKKSPAKPAAAPAICHANWRNATAGAWCPWIWRRRA